MQRCVGSAAALSGAAATRALAAQRQSDARPNIILLLTDDQRWDMMGCAGHPVLKTPNMDALAGGGILFRNAFVTTSICAASRASIFTGMVERTHQYTFGTPPLRRELTDVSYPALLRKAGYRTGFVGKFGVSVEAGAREEMFGVFRPLSRNPYLKERADGSLRHVTDITGDEAISFLRSCKPRQPFCLSVSFNAPHAEDRDPRQYIWPEATDELYRDAALPPPAGADPAFFESLPGFLKESLNRVRWAWRFDSPQKAEEMTKGYYRMISGVDVVIGRLLEELEELGLADNTVVVFTGDNGYFVGERGFAGKWLGYEPSLRVPLIIRDPRPAASEARGSRPGHMALNIDLAPTLLDLAGVSRPKQMQGHSLVPILRGQPPPLRTHFFCEHLFEHRQIPKFEGVRTERWKYLRYFQQAPVHEELYDLAADPDETRNLVADAARRTELVRLRARCDDLRDRYGGPYVPRARPKPKQKAAARPAPAGYTEGVRGKCAVFDGSSYLAAGSVPALAADDSFSWSFWVKADANSRRSGVMVGNRRREEGDALQFMKVTPETVQLFNGMAKSVKQRHDIPLGAWAHVAVVKTGRVLACYVDGRKTVSAKVDFGLPELPFYLGGDPRAGELATCHLDEVRTYIRALTLEEVARLRRLEPVETGLLGYWPLDGAGE